MTTQTGAMPAAHFRRGWIYVLTLSLVTINYMDRSALGVVAQAIRTEFKLSPVEMGYLFSSFFWSYVVFLLPIGIMLDRFSTRTINSVGIVVWSLAMAATAGVWSFATLIGARLVMGAGEATSIPSCGRIVREWMPAQERGAATVFWSAGSFVGPAIGAIVVAALTSAWGWRAAFIVLGAFGLVWLVCNLIWFDKPEKVSWLTEDERRKILSERSAGSPDEIGMQGSPGVIWELLKSPSMWGTMIAQASGIYTLIRCSLPSYLRTPSTSPSSSRGPIPRSWGDPGAGEHRVAATGSVRNALRPPPRHGHFRNCSPPVVFVPFTDTRRDHAARRRSPARAAIWDPEAGHHPDVGKAISLCIPTNIFGWAPIITGYGRSGPMIGCGISDHGARATRRATSSWAAGEAP